MRSLFISIIILLGLSSIVYARSYSSYYHDFKPLLGTTWIFIIAPGIEAETISFSDKARFDKQRHCFILDCYVKETGQGVVFAIDRFPLPPLYELIFINSEEKITYWFEICCGSVAKGKRVGGIRIEGSIAPIRGIELDF